MVGMGEIRQGCTANIAFKCNLNQCLKGDRGCIASVANLGPEVNQDSFLKDNFIQHLETVLPVHIQDHLETASLWG